MSQWWSYRPADFLMFSAASYGRLLERFHRDTWPLALVMLGLGLGLVLLWALARRPQAMARGGTVVLAAVWLWVAWGFVAGRLGEIQIGANLVAAALAAQSAVLVAITLQRGAAPEQSRRAGLLVAVAGLLLWLLLAPLTGRTWMQAEVFGMEPAPTALFTLGWLWATGLRHRGWAAVIPGAVLVLGGGLLWLLYLGG
jgi:hypothetical protein